LIFIESGGTLSGGCPSRFNNAICVGHSVASEKREPRKKIIIERRQPSDGVLEMQWTPEKLAQLERLWREYSASEVARIMGTTRNSVCGAIYRMQRATKVAVERLPARVALARQKPKLKPKPISAKQAMGPPPNRPKFSTPPVRNRNIMCPCQLTELERENCRWPIGDPLKAEFYFCGAVMVPDAKYPYCPTHLRQAVNPNSTRGQQQHDKPGLPAKPVLTLIDDGIVASSSFATPWLGRVIAAIAADIPPGAGKTRYIAAAVAERIADPATALTIAERLGRGFGGGGGIACFRFT
jgi:GcrA cell cycle regulator